jgi:hypothetical protein
MVATNSSYNDEQSGATQQMREFIHAAWPVVAIVGGGFFLFAFWRVLLTRSCWRCLTPLRPSNRKKRLLKYVPITRCDRCGAWRGCLIR